MNPAHSSVPLPTEVANLIAGREVQARSGEWFAKLSPVDGSRICRVSRSAAADVADAVAVAAAAQPAWAEMPAVRRGNLLYELAALLERRRADVAAVVARETGKSFRDALGETDGAVQLGRFFAGEGQRLYGRTTTSGVPRRLAMTLRQPIGVAGLIVAANTPIANVAWKVFPALICGNTAVLKAAEDTPLTAWLFGRLAAEAGLPAGVLNVVQGLGPEAGAALVDHPGVGVISFTGSSAVGRNIAVAAGRRLARVSLELGGKNPLLVCDDADLDLAVRWTLLSAFSNAGQRCAAAGRIIVLSSVYERFRELLLAGVERLRVGPGDDDDFGPVINARQLGNMLAAVDGARARGAVVLCGGRRLDDPAHADGCYMAPTVIENVDPADEISTRELFGPITCLYRAADFPQALRLANDSPYGLTASIHTRSLQRAMQFTRQAQCGVVMVNAGTYGSEPHMPFGGRKDSGNGSREPGTEALDVYCECKDVYWNSAADEE